MRQKKCSKILKDRAPIIRERVFCHPCWTNRRGFKKRWRTTRRNARKILEDLSDLYVDSLVRIAENLGVSFGDLLGLGTWHYDPNGLVDRIGNLVKMLDISDSAFSKRCGFSTSFISQIKREGFKRGSRLSTIETIAQVAGVNIRRVLSAC